MRKFDDGTILFSVQDMFGYLRAHATMSGIQRVQAGIALYGIAKEAGTIGFILNDLTDRHRDGEFLLIDQQAFRDIILYASGDKVDHHQLRRMLNACEEAAERVRPGLGVTIVLLGAFWGHGNTIDRYVTSRREGVKIGAYVYDIIPVTHPEFCEAGLARDFSMSVAEMGLVVDFIFTISDYTQETLAKLFRENGGRTIPMRTVPLAHSLTIPDLGVESWPAALNRIRGRRYVAYISTVEARKNHLYIVNAWREMIAQGIDVPDLVFVGRKGWRISGLMDLLDGTRYLGDRVHIVHDLSDAELNSVYAHCLFTVFSSFVEGWGLPVGESLIHNVPCVASSTSSIPEVGGAFVDYIDPLNLRDGIERLKRLIEDGDYRDARREDIRSSFTPRGWDDVGADFFAKTREAMAVDYPTREIYPTLPEGTRFSLGALTTEPIIMSRYVPSPMRMTLVGSFYGLEAHGAWMRGNTGELQFLTGLDEGETVIVYLEFNVPSGQAQSIAVHLLDGRDSDRGGTRWQHIPPETRSALRTKGKIGAGGLCTILIELGNELAPLPGGDSRLIGVGLSAVGYARESDILARENVVEHFTFHDLSPIEGA